MVEMNTEVRHVLLDMKSHLSKGWLQGTYGDGDSKDTSEKVCLFGALIKTNRIDCYAVDPRNYPPGVTGRGDRNYHHVFAIITDSPEEIAIKLLAEKAGVYWKELAVWQDAPERTHVEIIDLIDSVLADLPSMADKEGTSAEVQSIK